MANKIIYGLYAGEKMETFPSRFAENKEFAAIWSPETHWHGKLMGVVRALGRMSLAKFKRRGADLLAEGKNVNMFDDTIAAFYKHFCRVINSMSDVDDNVRCTALYVAGGKLIPCEEK